MQEMVEELKKVREEAWEKEQELSSLAKWSVIKAKSKAKELVEELKKVKGEARKMKEELEKATLIGKEKHVSTEKAKEATLTEKVKEVISTEKAKEVAPTEMEKTVFRVTRLTPKEEVPIKKYRYLTNYEPRRMFGYVQLVLLAKTYNEWVTHENRLVEIALEGDDPLLDRNEESMENEETRESGENSYDENEETSESGENSYDESNDSVKDGNDYDSDYDNDGYDSNIDFETTT